MPVPDYQTLMLPLLAEVGNCEGEVKMTMIADRIADRLSLSQDDVSELLTSGRQTIFMNRLHWAKTYMQKAGLIESTRRGFFQITEQGKTLIEKGVDRVDNNYLARFDGFNEWRASYGKEKPIKISSSASKLDEELTPEDRIEQSFQEINTQLSSDLIERVLESGPVFFEQLIVNLLIEMGYGGGRAEMGKALGRTNDGGIDGVVKEDELGLDAIYVQAKCYDPANSVTISSIRDFVGSLEGHQASKGIFVTTSRFPNSALDFVSRISKRVVLIDGTELTRLMIRHGVGVRTKEAYEIKRVDEDFFDAG